MAISAEFQNALSNKDLLMARIMLKDSLIIDPTFRDFDMMIKAAETALPDLYMDHDGEMFVTDMSVWDKAYMDKQMVKLMGNFSKERIDHLKVVCRHLYGSVAEKMERERFIDEHQKPSVTKKQVGTGMVIGGAAVAVAGIVTSHPVVIAIGAAVAVVGGVLIITDK